MQLSLIAKRCFTRLFRVFPVKKKQIFFSSYEGKQYSCNPRAIFRKLTEQHPQEYTVVWEYNDDTAVPEELKKEQVITVRHNSLAYFYRLLTSGVIITNSGITAAVALRPNQLNINTWHGGGAYKKVGAVISGKVNGTDSASLKIMADQTDWFVSSSEKFTEIMIPSVLIPKERFLNVGMPRNDVFFDANEVKRISQKVRENIGVEQAEKLILFAPTYRGNAGEAKGIESMFDIEKVLQACTQRFGGNWKLLVRSHYHADMFQNADGCINVSSYPDMQELLCAADILISDYSSCIWDFSFTGRPCFLYTPDLDCYSKERSFYTDIYTWPAWVAKDSKELCTEITTFSKTEFHNHVQEHHALLNNYDCGTASEQIVKLITGCS